MSNIAQTIHFNMKDERIWCLNAESDNIFLMKNTVQTSCFVIQIARISSVQPVYEHSFTMKNTAQTSRFIMKNDQIWCQKSKSDNILSMCFHFSSEKYCIVLKILEHCSKNDALLNMLSESWKFVVFWWELWFLSINRTCVCICEHLNNYPAFDEIPWE